MNFFEHLSKRKTCSPKRLQWANLKHIDAKSPMKQIVISELSLIQKLEQKAKQGWKHNKGWPQHALHTFFIHLLNAVCQELKAWTLSKKIFSHYLWGDQLLPCSSCDPPWASRQWIASSSKDHLPQAWQWAAGKHWTNTCLITSVYIWQKYK